MNSRYLFILVCLIKNFVFASVEHKNDYIDNYLSNISSNMSEKTELITYIKNNPNGTFLDIGTGGDGIAHMVLQLPKDIRPTLIAADIDQGVINSIPKRQPEIAPFINSIKGPKVELLTMSAVKMNAIKDSSIMGIGASALMHEIFSYVSSKSPIDQFISEVLRTLEKDGVFIYRDPLWVDHPHEQGILILRNQLARFYTFFFLTKLLDRNFSQIKDYRGICCKPSLYQPSDIKIDAYPKNSNCIAQSKQISFEDFLNHSSRIDYSKTISIEAPLGLIMEIQRHYLMFLKDYFPLSLIDEKLLDDDLPISKLNSEQQEALLSTLKRKSISLNDGVLRKNDISQLLAETRILEEIFNTGYHAKIDAKNKPFIQAMIEQLNALEDYRHQIYFADNDYLTIEPIFLSLLFQGKEKGLFKFLPKESLPMDTLEHLKLEGEEHYFYMTIDQLITYMGQYSKFELKDTHKMGYLLAPFSVDCIRKYPRTFYKNILCRDMLIMDLHGNIHEPITDKNVIHFKLQPENSAYNIYKQLIREESNKFPSLTTWMNSMEKEMLDVFTDDGRVIETLDRDIVYASGKNNFRVVNAFIINSKKQIWIPKRHPSKKLFPLCLDCSVGGHVRTGEDYQTAFARETQEEVGLNLENVSYKLLKTLSPKNDNTSAFMQVYAIYYDGPIDYNKNDFISYQWMTPDEALKLIDKGIPAKNDLKIILEKCFNE